MAYPQTTNGTLKPPKRRRYSPIPEPPRHPDAAAVVTSEIATELLNRANAAILKSHGFNGATALAGERVRVMAEEFYLDLLRQTSLFMHSQRRSRPTILDIQTVLSSNSIPISYLETELTRLHITHPTPLPPPLQLTQAESYSDPTSSSLTTILGSDLDGATDKRAYIPEHMPPFPSKHTYLETPVYTERPREPRVIREMATKEAVLAENALRKLLAAAGNKTSSTSTQTQNSNTTDEPVQHKKRKQRDSAWERAFGAMNGSSPESPTNIPPPAQKQAHPTTTRRIKQERHSPAPMTNGISGGGGSFTDSAYGSYSYSNGSGSANNPTSTATTTANNNNNDIWLEVIVNADSSYWRNNAKPQQSGQQQQQIKRTDGPSGGGDIGGGGRGRGGGVAV